MELFLHQPHSYELKNDNKDKLQGLSESDNFKNKTLLQ